MPMTFNIIDKDGVMYVDDPRIRAYAYMVQLRLQGRDAALIVDQGRYIVGSRGLATLTFAPEE